MHPDRRFNETVDVTSFQPGTKFIVADQVAGDQAGSGPSAVRSYSKELRVFPRDGDPVIDRIGRATQLYSQRVLPAADMLIEPKHLDERDDILKASGPHIVLGLAPSSSEQPAEHA